MSLDGLRAWIGEVERKLGMRTRVFLVLAVIAVGGAGTAIYLAIDARESSVSESDVQALQEQLETRIDEGSGGAGAGLATLEAELDALRAQVEQLSGEGGASDKGKGGSAEGGASETEGDGASPGGAGSRLEQLLEQTQKQNEQAEQGSSGG